MTAPCAGTFPPGNYLRIAVAILKLNNAVWTFPHTKPVFLAFVLINHQNAH
jgi:hypothetical protein